MRGGLRIGCVFRVLSSFSESKMVKRRIRGKVEDLGDFVDYILWFLDGREKDFWR